MHFTAGFNALNVFVPMLLPSYPQICLDPHRQTELDTIITRCLGAVLIGAVDSQTHLEGRDVFQEVDCGLEQYSEGDLGRRVGLLFHVYILSQVQIGKYLPYYYQPWDYPDRISKHVRSSGTADCTGRAGTSPSGRRPPPTPS